MKFITVTLMPIEIGMTGTSGDNKVNSAPFTIEPKFDNFGGVMSES